ncbi:hypothetical protein [Streptomyces vinaceus]|uniref:hypothetical protein n=1 Tax=Streptomyces vinaceus TaxID=1960 RepID=UPI001997BAAE|nr:hypothetical protein [Streptomyces vinaceus]GHE38333.1 hypothetical protein GCM10017778_22030 [Streptomyces vinaceus]
MSRATRTAGASRTAGADRVTGRRRAACALAALASATALLLTGCGPGASAGPAGGTRSVSGSDEATVKDMQQKLDDAESAAAQADSNATQDN